MNGTIDPIAIIGFAFKFPQDVTSEDSLWNLLLERRSTRTDVPMNRWNLDGFYKPYGNRPGTVMSRGGHFIADDPARFDAPFFSIQPAEAECMDPQQRFLLETSYHALENAGIPMETAMGSRTSVHVGCLLQEYSQISQRDTEMPGSYQIVGSSGLSMLANRLSWFYDFTGPSMTVDTACSGSLLAVHLGCQDLLSGTVDMALACGSNLSLVPDSTSLLSALKMMSPDSTCYSFDERANGYSRSEGFGVVIMKRLSRALQDGDTIRAVIRSTLCNQDGHTPGITQPSQSAQEQLTRETYEHAGLDRDKTRYFEAHGPGTAIGDPIEACAISNAFSMRTSVDPIYVGALKSNIGHPEAVSGIAAIIKTVLVLEHGTIPPNLYPERINPAFASRCSNLAFPLELVQWPTNDVRRASINSFGYGGTNVHVVMDDALSFLTSHELKGHHQSRALGPDDDVNGDDSEISVASQFNSSNVHLIVLSAFDERAVQRYASVLQDWMLKRDMSSKDLADVAFTLGSKRSRFAWKTFAVGSLDSLSELSWSKPTRIKNLLRICFVFTGQGAQWSGMGRELLKYDVFRDSIEKADIYLRRLGCKWSIRKELVALPSEDSRINYPELSQTICTALQVAIVDLLSSWHIEGSTFIGHSSGEIAAAYASGSISRESAWMIAYFRGVAVGSADSNGRMVVVPATAESLTPLLNQLNDAHPGDGLTIACYNSLSNVTISGSSNAISRLLIKLKDVGITFRVLNVSLAYHSSHMNHAAAQYGKLLQHTKLTGTSQSSGFISTVTGTYLHDTAVLKTSEYWTKNLTEPVRFSTAITEACKRDETTSPANFFVEIGPHATLRSPIRDIFQEGGRETEDFYSSVLHRGQRADITALECIGKLLAVGIQIDLRKVNLDYGPFSKLITTLPKYPFNDQTRYWLEGRTSAQYRFRKHAHNEFLGTRVDDWNEYEARWNNRIILNQSSWLGDHQVNGRIIFPAAGFVVMALEAVRQLHEDRKHIAAYQMRGVRFLKAVTISHENQGTQLQITLRTVPFKTAPQPKCTFEEFNIYVYEDGWQKCCTGEIAVQYKQDEQCVFGRGEYKKFLQKKAQSITNASSICKTPLRTSEIYNAFERAGISYGSAFRSMQDVNWNREDQATGSVQIRHWESEGYVMSLDPHLIHPSALDAVLQMTFPAYSIYRKESPGTTVPISLSTAWFSEDLAQAPPNAKALVHAQVKSRGFRNHAFSVAAMVDRAKYPCFFGTMETTTFSNNETLPAKEKKPLYRIEYKPDFDLLPKSTIFLESCKYASPKLVEEKEELCLCSMQNALSNIKSAPAHLPTHLQEYIYWMRTKLSKHVEATAEHIEALCQKLEPVDVEARLLVRVARNLQSVLLGQTDALTLLFADDILSEFYANSHSTRELFSHAAEQIDILAHKFPSMRVLEIGAGTGSATAYVFAALGDRVAEYVYTDITPNFFTKAKQKFQSSKMTFKTLDISRDPIEQGYHADFDLIVAANVLHAANGIENALIQCRKLLSPQGRILLFEMTNREHILEPFIFGLLPGLSQKKNPDVVLNQSPIMTEGEWGDMLLKTGFSGLDILISDAGFLTEKSVSAVMISSAVESNTLPQIDVYAIYDESNAAQKAFLGYLHQELTSQKDISINPVPLSSIEKHNLDQCFCLFLGDLDGNLLAHLQEDQLEKLKTIVSVARTVVWLNFQDPLADELPTYGLIPGLARTLASENNECRIISVVLDYAKGVQNAATNVVRVLKSASHATGIPEDEFYEKNGLLHIPRVITDGVMRDKVFAEERIVRAPWKKLENPGLTIATAGHLRTIHFEQTPDSGDTLGPDDIVVAVKAVGLDNRDYLVSQGQIHDKAFGSSCAGVVVRISHSPTHDLRVDDKVFGITRSALRQKVRCKSFQMHRIPENMEFSEAAACVQVLCIAYFSLIQFSRLRKGERILIHYGKGTLGQAAIQIAKLYECDIFITTDNLESAAFLRTQFAVPEEHIMPLNASEFCSGVNRMTHGQGVDVIFTSAPSQNLYDLWQCLAPFGRLVDTSAKEYPNYSKNTSNFPNGENKSMLSVDPQSLLQAPKFSEILSEVARLIKYGKLKAPDSIPIFHQNELVNAFKFLQNEDNNRDLVIQIRDNEPTAMTLSPHKERLFNAEATYFLAGGFGGVGRSVARWMIEQGAQYLILPSRSTVEGSGSEREKFVQQLRDQGADIRAPQCDIANLDELKDTLSQLKDMPPIKGCVQAAMVVRDSSFAKMTIKDWHASLAPKVRGSWNLHKALPVDLDFFIMFSSSTGIMGSFGQSNYTAGNTFQDALAAHRLQLGQRTFSIAFSMITGVGWVAENSQVQALLKARGMIEEVTLNDIFELLRFCCDAGQPNINSQIITPLSLPADLRTMGIVEPLGSTRAIYSYLHILPSRYDVSAASGDKPAHQPLKLPSAALQNALSFANAVDIIIEAIQTQLSNLLVVGKDDIDPKNPIHKYGVDSLVAVEMRNWFAKGVGADVSSAEILDNIGIADLAKKVGVRSKYVKDDLKEGRMR